MKKILFLILICMPQLAWPETEAQASSSLLNFMPTSTKPMSLALDHNASNSTHTESNHTASSDITIPTLPQPPQAVHTSYETPRGVTIKSWTPEKLIPEKAEDLTPEQRSEWEKLQSEERKNEKIYLNFENVSLATVTNYMQDLFDVIFLPDNIIKPLMQNAGTIEGHTVSFKSQRGLSHDEVWNIFVRFLDMAGLVIFPASIEKTYRIVSANGANQRPLPVYFDTNLDKIPQNPEKIRYVYYVKNNQITTLQNIATTLASNTAAIDIVTELNALIITDKAHNIRSLMNVIQELDKNMPEAMSIIKLKSTDATTVMGLYQSLTSAENPQNRPGTQKKQPSLYFPINVRMIPEPRTNCLILLGTKAGIEKIENFITQYIDTELQTPFSPLHTYQLQYTKAPDIAGYLNSVLAFGQGSQAAQYGGVRDGNSYFQAVTITPEPTTNTLVIRSSDEDYKKLEDIIKVLDVEQPQVAIEVLIFDVSTTDAKNIGFQFRNKNDGSFIKNVNAQFSGIGGVVTDTNTGGLLGNLISLATGTGNPIGTTMLSIKNAAGDIWGLFRILQTYVDTRIIANPFLVATNKYQATSSFGSTRQVQVAQVGASTQSFGTVSASLDVNITPQINSDGLINMAITIKISDFTGEANSGSNADTFNKSIQTSVQVADGQVIVLGGITKNQVVDSISKIPLLGDIPLVGNLFRSKTKTNIRTNLLVFIAPRIITSSSAHHMNSYTQSKNEEVKTSLSKFEAKNMKHDPVNKFFFNNGQQSADEYSKAVDAFMNIPNTQEYSQTHHEQLPSAFMKKNKRRLNIQEQHVAQVEFNSTVEPSKTNNSFRKKRLKKMPQEIITQPSEEISTLKKESSPANNSVFKFKRKRLKKEKSLLPASIETAPPPAPEFVPPPPIIEQPQVDDTRTLRRLARKGDNI